MTPNDEEIGKQGAWDVVILAAVICLLIIIGGLLK